MICGASLAAATGIYAIEGVAGLFGRLLFGVLADRIGVRKVIVGGLVLQAIGIYAYIYLSEINQFYMLAAVLGLAYGGRHAALFGAGTRVFLAAPARHRARRRDHDLEHRHGLRPARRRLALRQFRHLPLALHRFGRRRHRGGAMALAFPPPVKDQQQGGGVLQPA